MYWFKDSVNLFSTGANTLDWTPLMAVCSANLFNSSSNKLSFLDSVISAKPSAFLV